MIELAFEEAKPLLKSADVLLFRNKGLISRFIKSATSSIYSHIGLVDITKDENDKPIYELIEVRQWVGGRAIRLENEIQKREDCSIDVYRSIPHFLKLEFDQDTKEILEIRKDFDNQAVTKTFRTLLGCVYGWRRIWWIWKYKMAGLRLFTNKEKLMEDESTPFYPICSSAVSYAYSHNGYDLIYNKGDGYTSPGDLARSTRLCYLFTI
jgi:hypothetical protein